MDFSEHKGIYVIGALANGKIQKVTGELTGEARVLADQLGGRGRSRPHRCRSQGSGILADLPRRR